MVIFQDEGSLSYSQIECLLKVKQNCCTCTAWMYLAVVSRLYLTDDPVQASDGSVKVTLQHVRKAYPAVQVGPDVITMLFENQTTVLCS